MADMGNREDKLEGDKEEDGKDGKGGCEAPRGGRGVNIRMQGHGTHLLGRYALAIPAQGKAPFIIRHAAGKIKDANNRKQVPLSICRCRAKMRTCVPAISMQEKKETCTKVEKC